MMLVGFALSGKRSESSFRAASRILYQKQRIETEKRLGVSVSSLISSQVKSAKSELQKLGSKAVASQGAESLANLIFNPRDWDKKLIDGVFPILARAMSEASVAYFLSLGFDPRRKKVRSIKSTATEWLENAGEDLPPGVVTELPQWMIDEIGGQLRDVFEQDYWKKINDTTYTDVRTFLNHGLVEGWSIPRMAKEISEFLPESYSKHRAMMVARTESGHALNGARDASYRRMKEELGDAGEFINKSWLSVLGNTTRDDHANLDGVLADAEGLFDLAGTLVPWPAHFSLPPEQRIACQCSLTTEFGAGAPSIDEIEQILVDEEEI